MIISQLIEVLEEWAPRWAAMERDNVGLQIGDPQRRVSRVLVAFEVTPKVVEEALARKAELLITHHPLIFRPLSALTTSDKVGKMVLKLSENKIALYSAHTNLDSAEGGVNFALAEALGLQNIRFLKPLSGTLAKIVVFVPEAHLDSVRNAMAQAGAGIIGKYSSCSFTVKGEGTFFASPSAHPYVGKQGKLERVNEMQLEMVVPRALVPQVVATMKDVHPYEEVAYDVLPVDTPNPNYGIGVLGELKKPESSTMFLKRIKRKLSASVIRYSTGYTSDIKRVALCGGAGSDLLWEAVRAKADALVTADVGYHLFHGLPDSFLLVDAGHWETEHLIVPVMANRLQQVVAQTNAPVKIYTSDVITNPIRFL